MTLRTSSSEVERAGELNSSQDGIIVRGVFLPVLPQDTATARKSLSLSRVKPQNVCSGGVFPTLNTRYEDAAIKDYITLSHFPKGCWMYVYETE